MNETSETSEARGASTMRAVRQVRRIDGPIELQVHDVPGSKSVANRALVCAALASGTSVIQRVAPGDDTAALIDCLHLLGVSTVCDHNSSATITGPLNLRRNEVVTLPTRLAGTTSRFLTAVAALSDTPVVIDGDAPLRARPMLALHQALRDLGATVESLDSDGHLPVRVSRGSLHGGVVRLPGDISSQYISALMMIAPLLAGGLRIEWLTPLISRPYVELTSGVMAAFGASNTVIDEHGVTVEAGRYVPADYAVEVDASSASYPVGMAAILGGSVTVHGLDASNRQGDARFVDLLASMGATITRRSSATTVTVSHPLRGIDIDMADISDTVPTLAAIAPFAVSPTTIRGVEFIRRKETDRIAAMTTELRRCGVTADELDDGLRIEPCRLFTPAEVETYHDHRIAMSMALVGSATGTLAIAEPDVVSKSWPNFWNWLDRVGTNPG